MVDTVQRPAVTSLPLAPKNPLPYRQRLEAARDLAAGPEMLRDAGGQVTRNILGPKWLLPPFVVVPRLRGPEMSWDARTPMPTAALYRCWWSFAGSSAATFSICRTTNGYRASVRCSPCSPSSMSCG